MTRSWLIRFFVVGVVLAIFFAFNCSGRKKEIPFEEIFSEEEILPVDIEYEFVQAEENSKPMPQRNFSKDNSKEETLPLENLEGSFYTIQISSFSDDKKAQSLLNELKEKGYPAFVVSRDLGEKGIWYRVRVGLFSAKAEAQEFLKEIEVHYEESFILKNQ